MNYLCSMLYVWLIRLKMKVRCLLALLPCVLILCAGSAAGAELRGQLLGGDGQPAPGVKVALHAYRMDTPLTTTVSAEFGETVSYDREEHLATEAVEATTDDQGRFEFADVAEGMYVLMIARRKNPGDSRLIEEFRPLPLMVDGADVDLSALTYTRRGAYVTGTVRLDRQPASAVRIRL